MAVFGMFEGGQSTPLAGEERTTLSDAPDLPFPDSSGKTERFPNWSADASVVPHLNTLTSQQPENGFLPRPAATPAQTSRLSFSDPFKNLKLRCQTPVVPAGGSHDGYKHHLASILNPFVITRAGTSTLKTEAAPAGASGRNLRTYT